MPIAARCGRIPWRTRSGRCRRSRCFRPASTAMTSCPGPVEQAYDGGAGDVIAEAVGRLEGDFDEVLAAGSFGFAGDASGETQRVVRKRWHAKANRQLSDHCLGPGPVGQETHAVAVG